MNIKDLTITSALKGLREKKFKAIDLVKQCLNNIKNYNHEYNVFLTVREVEKLIEDARKIDSTDYSSPLSGIPIALKDLFTSADLRTTAGSKVLDNYYPVYNATVVKKLIEAGAIIIGKVNEDAWGHGSSGENSDFGPTGNAYNPKYVAGGSSSGSAVAVALGMCLAATGTDTGGSIRVPASYNNLVGLKPTYGRVSRYGIIAMASSLDSIGHITKTVEDSAYLLHITAGKDVYDATTGIKDVPNYFQSLNRKDLHGITIGVSHTSLHSTQGIARSLQNKVEEAKEKLRSLGAKIDETIEMPHLADALEAYYILVPSEISSNLARYDGIRYGNLRDSFGPEAKRRIMIGTYALSSGYYDAYYKTAQRVRTLICQDYAQTFSKVNVILAPVTPIPPYEIGKKVSDPIALYLSDIFAVPVNIAGLPAISLPAGKASNDLPIGFQLIGPKWSEELLFSVGATYEKEHPWLKSTV